ncbi:hypothetical protein LA66_00065 [Aureimonas altamirensis]|uniref:Phage tail tape measure protein domain-containing protein n=1 Tax=Aureimonas altamirensis TaxID=370622 RepID=A0A0B1Q8A4_9HYPH|nr:phage tail tape measure protein [Aureimonas altamirensis]KHJ55122.1 hypothetical protein LA66_00065 [Aureimonas altamirensis]
MMAGNATVDAELRIRATNQTRPGLASASKDVSAFARKQEQVNAAMARGAQANAINRQVALVERTQSALGKAQSGIAAYGRDAARAFGPLAAGFAAVDIMKTSASFETSLTEIAKKGDLTEEGLKGVRKEIFSIIESGDVAMDPSEIAASYERGIAAGLPLDKMREFVTLTAQAADSWDMGGEETGNAFAGFQQSLKIGLDDMRSYADLLNTLADAGISDERDIVDFIDRAGASLKDLGMQNETIAAMGATLLDLKMPAEQAATAMNAFSTKLLTPDGTKASAAAFKTLYGSVDDFKDLLKTDADKAVRDFFSRLKKLDNFERTSILKDIVGQEHSSKLNRLIASIDLYDERVATAMDPSQYIGSLSRSYGRKLDTAEAKWKQFVSNLTLMKIDLGDLILPPGVGFLEEAIGEIQKLRGVIEDVGEVWESATGTGFSIKGLHEALDIRGTHAAAAAEAAAGRSRETVFEEDPSSGAAAGFGARDMSGVDEAMVMVRRQIQRKRRASEIFDEQVQIDANEARWNRLRGAAAQVGRENDAIIDLTGGELSQPPDSAGRGARVTTPPESYGARVTSSPEGRIGGAFEDSVSPAIDGLDQSTDRLRQAMEEGGATIVEAGPQSGQGFADAASAGIAATAAQSGAAFGQAAAAAFNANVRIPMPTSNPNGSRPLANRWPKVNANLGHTMPHAGEPPGSY